YGLKSIHLIRNVAGDCHAAFVRLSRQRAQHFGADRAVDFDLIEPGALVTLHNLLRLLDRIRADDAERSGRGSIDYTGQQQPRTNRQNPGIDSSSDCANEFELIADITARSDASRKISRTPFNLLEMCVHIP